MIKPPARHPMMLACGALLALYLCWVLGLGAWLAPTMMVLLIATLLVTMAVEAHAGRWPGVLFLAAITVLALGSPSIGWDARSIWLFHAKRIYFDQDLLSQLDRYGAWSNNDYPVFVPAIGASLASLVGRWNEVFPKLSGVIVMAPALLIVLGRLPSNVARLAFLALFTACSGSLLVNGYMDALLAVYFVAAFALVQDLVAPIGQGGGAPPSPGGQVTMATFSVLSILALLKNEGPVALVCVVAAWLACGLLHRTRLPRRAIVVVAAALLLLLHWKVMVAGHGIPSDVAGSDLWGQFRARLPDPANALLIANAMFGGWPFLLAAALFAMAGWQSWRSPSWQATLLAAGSYAGVLFLVYMATPNDLAWHLATSANRTIIPVTLLLGFEGISWLLSSSRAHPATVAWPMESESPRSIPPQPSLRRNMCAARSPAT